MITKGHTKGSAYIRKTASYLIPAFLLMFFVLIMNAGPYLKQPRGRSDDVAGSIRAVRADVLDQKWDSAGVGAGNLEKAWNKVIPRIQFSVEREEINSLSRNIYRLQGYITAGDMAGALAELREAERNWNGLDR